MIRGEVYWADFGVPFGSETGFRRPVIIVQTNEFNIKELQTVIVVPLTTNLMLADAPANVYLDKSSSSLSKDSVAVISQTGAIDKSRLIEKIGIISHDIMTEIEEGIRLILGL